MRSFLLCSIAAAVMAAPLGSQTCKKTPAPFLPDLFPRSVGGRTLEFSGVPSGGCMGMYRPTGTEQRGSVPWVVVGIQAEPSDTLGESAAQLRTYFATEGIGVITVDDWPVSVKEQSVGDEFMIIKGSLRITVLVKNGDHGPKSQAVALPYLRLLLAKVKCG